MTNELTNRESKELSADINVITAEINAYQRVAGEAIFEIGRRLKSVRENPKKYGFEGYRDWERWCEEELGMTRRNANRFIKVVDRFGDTGVPTLPNTMSVLYELTSFTDEQLKQEYELPNGEKKKPVDMSRRQIEELKRQLRQAEKQAEVERRERERLEKEKDAERSERERLEDELEKTSKIEVRTEYVEVENVPQDYEEIKQENAKLRRKFGDGKTRVIDDEARREFYQDFANDLDYIVGKYGSIVFDGDKIKEFGSSDVEYASKVNNFDEFWKRYVRTVIEDQTIINAEGF